MSEGGSNKKVANGLLALSSAAVFAVYTAGYVRTRSAAERLAQHTSVRPPVAPAPSPQAADARPAPDALRPSVDRDAGAVAAAPRAVRATDESVAVSAPPSQPVADPAPVRSSSGESRAVAIGSAESTAAPAADQSAPTASILAATVTDAPALGQAASAATAAPSVAGLPAPQASPAEPVPAPYKDGTYLGWGSSRHGDIQASVVIANGRIASATIAQCRTRYSCSVIAALPPQVALRQSPDVDYVSGATQSTYAFYYAVVEALAKAR